MVKVNTAADYSKYFKAETKEANEFQNQLQKEFGLRLPTETQTVLEDKNNNGVADKGDKPLRQYTTYSLHAKVLSKNPEIVSFLKKNGYDVYEIKRDGDGKPTHFLFIKADQKYAFQKDIKNEKSLESKTQYAQTKPNKPADDGVAGNGSGVHGGHPVNKHLAKQPKVAKKDADPKPAQDPKVKPDSKRKVGSDEAVKNDDGGTIKVGDFKTGPFKPELKAVTDSEFKKLTKVENIPSNDQNIERALVYRPNNDPKFNMAWGDSHNEQRINDVIQFAASKGYKILKFPIHGEDAYLFVK